MSQHFPVNGAGLGLRRTHLGPLLDHLPEDIDFMEVAPENWMGAGGRLGKVFETLAARIPIACHGLLLNLGGPDPLNEGFLRQLRPWLDTHAVPVYGDHLTWCAEGGQLYELLPIPFTEDAVHYVAERIRRTQDIVGRRIAVENASYYFAPGQELSETDFINAVLSEADCLLLIDINNIYVNSVNHGYDAREFLRSLPAERIAYAHIAGHAHEAEDLIVDTHGAPIVDPVWALLDYAYQQFGVFPTLVERDENIPPLEECLEEVRRVAALQARHSVPAAAAS